MAEPNIRRIRSGGQTGVDRAALDAAVAAGIPHGGWCPSGRRAEDGRIPDRYDLRETASPEYAERTRLNVRDSDGTLILSSPDPTGGTLLTLQVALGLRKPVFLIDPNGGFSRRRPAAWLCSWLDANGIRELNVAGPRGSSSPEVYRDARRFMDDVLSTLGSPRHRQFP